MQALVSGELVLDSQLATRLSALVSQPAAIAPDLFRAEKAVRDNVTALLAKTSLATPSACPARGAICLHPGIGATLAEQVSRCVAGRRRNKAKRAAAPAGRRAHQQPDRPPAGHLRGNRAQPPENTYERLQLSSRTAAVTRALADRWHCSTARLRERRRTVEKSVQRSAAGPGVLSYRAPVTDGSCADYRLTSENRSARLL
jgi:hypothetical protein